MNLDPSWITAGASTLALISLFLIFWKVKAYHDNERRKFAFYIGERMDDALTRNTFRYLSLVFDSSADQLNAIREGKPLRIDSSKIEKYLPEYKDNGCESSSVTLEVDVVLEIRFTIIQLMNAFESMALSYKYETADIHILEEAYSAFLFEHQYLQNFRRFARDFKVGQWPALEELESLVKPAQRRRALA